MKILAFDTANNSASACASFGNKIVAYREELRNAKQAETILPMIEEVLDEAGYDYNDLDYVAVTNGPGSFTGIRIGLAVAQGILFGTQIQGIAVSNFEFSWFRAMEQVEYYDKIFVILNAYREQLYMQIFDKNGNSDIPRLVDYDAAVYMLAQEVGVIVCAGSGLELIYEQIQHMPHITLLPRFTRVKALHICRYIAYKLALKQPMNNIIAPLYIRPADAKINIVN